MKKCCLVFISLCLVFLFSFSGVFAQKSTYNMKRVSQYYRAKNYNKVKEILELWLAKSPGSFPPAGFLILGNIYDQLKLFSAAIQVYQKGLALSKNKFPFYVNMAQVYRHMKQHKKAIEMLNKIRIKGALYPEIYLFLGMSYFELRNRLKTILYWKAYLDYRPSGKKSVQVRKALAWLNQKDFKWPEELTKQSEKKKEDLEKFLKDLKKTVKAANEKNINKSLNLKEGKLEIKDKGKEEGEKFDEIER